MKLHIVDGTYELFRAYFSRQHSGIANKRPSGAVKGLIQSLLALSRRDDVTHIAVAFDHVIESFRNELFPGYKSSEGIHPALLAQFKLAEEATLALGLVVWPMIEFEADDAMASAVLKWQDWSGMEQIVICSPDKDMAQMVRGDQVVYWDRRRNLHMNEDSVVHKFGVLPQSIPDYLALVGDSADGIPGVPQWGAKASAKLLKLYHHIECIPEESSEWEVNVRGANRLANNLVQWRDSALLYRRLATLRTDVPIEESIDDLRWLGVPYHSFQKLCVDLGFYDLISRPQKWVYDS